MIPFIVNGSCNDNRQDTEAKKDLLFPEMWMTSKIFTRAAANLFFLIDFLTIFSFLLFLLLFLYPCFLCLFVCLFFEIKNIYSDTHSTMRTGEWWKNFTWPTSGNKTTFFGLTLTFLQQRLSPWHRLYFTKRFQWGFWRFQGKFVLYSTSQYQESK